MKPPLALQGGSLKQFPKCYAHLPVSSLAIESNSSPTIRMWFTLWRLLVESNIYTTWP